MVGRASIVSFPRVTLMAGDICTLPFTFTLPSAMRPSAARLEATPASASALARRTGSEGGGGLGLRDCTSRKRARRFAATRSVSLNAKETCV